MFWKLAVRVHSPLPRKKCRRDVTLLSFLSDADGTDDGVWAPYLCRNLRASECTCIIVYFPLRMCFYAVLFSFSCSFGDGGEQLQRVEQEAEAARKTLGLQTEEDKKRAQFADELERKRHVDQVRSQSSCGLVVVVGASCVRFAYYVPCLNPSGSLLWTPDGRCGSFDLPGTRMLCF